MLPYSRALKYPARTLRNHMTDAEQRLWACIRRQKIEGVAFYRQKPLLGYVVDFYCAAAMLVIEVDGEYHRTAAQCAQDKQRTEDLESLGIKVLRFENAQILGALSAVIERIRYEVTIRKGMNMRRAGEGLP
ncbi:MAG: endonuclease domain-containing protein [Pseudomonas sp.]